MKTSWMKRQQYLGFLFIGPNMVGVMLFFIVPALYSFYLMFTDYKFMSTDTKFVGLANIQKMLGDEVFYISIKNTLFLLLSVPISIGLAFISGEIRAALLCQGYYADADPDQAGHPQRRFRLPLPARPHAARAVPQPERGASADAAEAGCLRARGGKPRSAGSGPKRQGQRIAPPV